MIMKVLYESATAHRRGQCMPEYHQFLTIAPPLSEIEFLHHFEACRELLRRAAGMRQCCRGIELLPLWIKLSRPHPSIMRRFLLGIEPHPNWAVDRQALDDLVNWSWESFNAVRSRRESYCGKST